MSQSQSQLRIAALAIVVSVLSAPDVVSVELKAETAAAFDRYVKATQTRIDRELARPGEFLYIEGLPATRRDAVLQNLRQGGIYIERLEARDANGNEIEIPGGLVHHWMGAVFVPGGTVAQAIALAQDYDHHQDIYMPEVVRSELQSRSGDDFKIYYRLRKHKVITVTLNTLHDVEYFRVDDNHWDSRSVSTRIAEVAGAGQAGEHELPVGNDGGFLWRIDSWWRYEQVEGGVIIESESASLTRDIPTGLGWLIGPFVTSIPKESLRMMLENTRTALRARATTEKNSTKEKAAPPSPRTKKRR
jgi:hypothetical protein